MHCFVRLTHGGFQDHHGFLQGRQDFACVSGQVIHLFDMCALLAGVSNFSTLKYYSQVQATARPVNASDPRLQLWIKTPINPLISQAPTSGSLAQFRDPVSAWKQVNLGVLKHSTQTHSLWKQCMLCAMSA